MTATADCQTMMLSMLTQKQAPLFSVGHVPRYVNLRLQVKPATSTSSERKQASKVGVGWVAWEGGGSAYRNLTIELAISLSLSVLDLCCYHCLLSLFYVFTFLACGKAAVLI